MLQPNACSRHRGLTLVELLMALAVLAVLAAIALPNLSAALAASHAAAARSALLTTMVQTVQRAALSGQHVVTCSGNPQQGCSGAVDWSAGWIAFVDGNQSRQLDDGERLLIQQPALDARVRLTSSRGRTRLITQPSGGVAGSNVTFVLCDSRGPSRARALILSNAGGLRDDRPSAERLQNACP